jgi:hypothetical protein
MRKVSIVLLIFTLGSLCGAQKPNITNARIQEVSAASGLKSALDALVQKQETPAWIGYRIPAVPKERTMCCFSSWSGDAGSGNRCCMGCKVESGDGGSFNGTVSNCSPPEPFHYSFVFLRMDAHKVMKVRNYSPDCALDFGGLPLYWMENVNPGQSVAVLTELVHSADEEANGRRSIADGAVAAIAFHDDPAADEALERLMRPENPEFIRDHVTFWLAEERGKKGFDLLRKYAREDPNDRLREKITFAFSVSKEPDAVKELISMARNDPSSRVRGQAIFWLGQIGGRKEAEQISDAIENDPETEVKKRAVFALAQMKDGEGVPLLINVAKTNKNPAVRREAVRWLGQSRDPRALDFLEEILTK